MKIAPILSNFRPVVSDNTRVIQAPEPKSTPPTDVNAVQKNLKSAEGLSTNDVLKQFDLRNIDRNGMVSFVQVLQERNAISEETVSSLLAFSISVFGDQASDVKMDFMGALEKQAENLFSGSEQVDEMVAYNMKYALSAVNSIEFAKNSGSDQIQINVTA